MAEDHAAQRRWDAKNPELRKYLSHRSRARSFIRGVATVDDLKELQGMITERLAEIGDKTAASDCAIETQEGTVEQ